MNRQSRAAISLISCLVFFSAADFGLAATYYVSLSGDDGKDGTAADTAWRTITHAAERAEAGDIVYVKAGNYGREHVVVRNSGTKDRPIVFEGYQRKPGDRPDHAYRPGQDLDASRIPVLDGEDRKGYAIHCKSRSHVRIRNIGIRRYMCAIYTESSEHIVLDSVVATNLDWVGFYFIDGANYCTARNCIVTDAGSVNIIVRGSHHCLIENCKTFGIDPDRERSVDYYIDICNGQHNTIRGCLSHNMHPQAEVHPGHGIGIKDSLSRSKGTYAAFGAHSHSNRVINCVARNHGEHFFVAHGAHHNEFINCVALSDWTSAAARWNEGINIRDGAHHNTFRNCRAEGARYSLVFQDTAEGPKNPDGTPTTQLTRNNSLLNCVFADAQVGFQFWNTRGNLLTNCVVHGAEGSLFEFRGTVDRDLMANAIVTNVKGEYASRDSAAKGDVTFTHSDFWNNKFKCPPGTGNIERDPLFAGAAKKDFHLKSGHGRWDGTSSKWVRDAATSPCIDAGAAFVPYSAEPAPNGRRVNIGAYGNTDQASRSTDKGQPGMIAETGDQRERLLYLTGGAAPPIRSLRGPGPLKALDFRWLPDAAEAGPILLKCTDGADKRELVLEPEGERPPKGWLAVNVEPLCGPWSVFAPDGSKHPSRSLGGFLLFRAEQAGAWRVEGLPLTGKLHIDGEFTCKRFRVKFPKGLDVELVYEHLPGTKSYRFETEGEEEAALGELTVHVGQPGEILAVKEDGEPCDEFERRGEYLDIHDVRTNVTYRIEKMSVSPEDAGD